MALLLCAVTLSSRKPALTTPGSPALVLGLLCFRDLSSSWNPSIGRQGLCGLLSAVSWPRAHL